MKKPNISLHPATLPVICTILFVTLNSFLRKELVLIQCLRHVQILTLQHLIPCPLPSFSKNYFQTVVGFNFVYILQNYDGDFYHAHPSNKRHTNNPLLQDTLIVLISRKSNSILKPRSVTGIGPPYANLPLYLFLVSISSSSAGLLFPISTAYSDYPSTFAFLAWPQDPGTAYFYFLLFQTHQFGTLTHTVTSHDHMWARTRLGSFHSAS